MVCGNTRSCLSYVVSQNWRVAWIGRDLKDHLIPAPCPGQGHLSGEQLAQSPNHLGLEHFLVWDIHFSRKAVKNMECFINLLVFLVGKALIFASPEGNMPGICPQ